MHAHTHTHAYYNHHHHHHHHHNHNNPPCCGQLLSFLPVPDNNAVVIIQTNWCKPLPISWKNMHGTTKPANQTSLGRMTVTSICNNGSHQFSYTPTVLSLILFSLPWYNHPGWLGIKHQGTYFFCFQPSIWSSTNTKVKINSFFKHDLPMLNMCLLSNYESNVYIYMYVWSKSYH